jgi:hypothetical protein
MSTCCTPTFTGGGTAGNVTRLTREQIESIPPTPTASPAGCLRCEPRGAFFQQTRQSHSLLLVSRQTKCEIQIPPTATTTTSCPSAPAPPAVLGTGAGWSATRTHPRVSKIEHVAAVTHRSSGQTTARLRDSILHASTVRGAEFVRRRAPPPPCPTPHAPQPGVPIAPNPPCNPGTQRVDYQSPWR